MSSIADSSCIGCASVTHVNRSGISSKRLSTTRFDDLLRMRQQRNGSGNEGSQAQTEKRMLLWAARITSARSFKRPSQVRAGSCKGHQTTSPFATPASTHGFSRPSFPRRLIIQPEINPRKIALAFEALTFLTQITSASKLRLLY